MREWYVVTYVFGAVFIAGQIYEYAQLVMEGLTLSSSAYGSVFYLATGFHGLHVTGGLIAFLLIIGRTFTTRHYSHAQATGAVVTSYYWHFVDVVWAKSVSDSVSTTRPAPTRPGRASGSTTWRNVRTQLAPSDSAAPRSPRGWRSAPASISTAKGSMYWTSPNSTAG